jgi:hypothetical protein
MSTKQITCPTVPRIARLELVWTQNDADNWTCNYDLVIPLQEVDCRGTFDHKANKRPKSHRIAWLDSDNCRRLPMGRTLVGTSHSPKWDSETLYIPFRDGAHIQWDHKETGLRMFIRWGDEARELIIDKEPSA